MTCPQTARGPCPRFAVEVIPPHCRGCQQGPGNAYHDALAGGWVPFGSPATGATTPRVTAATKKTRKKCKGCGGNAFRLGWTFVKAQAKFAADGFQCVDQAEYDRRRAICEACEHLTGTRCGVCGCFVSLKAAGRVWTCDEGKWGTPPQ